ncbi:MAG: Sirohydrochlorin ferrochelatase [Pseudomonadota bacterium]|jgi:sirohydrochlorin cobaltochelatase
MSALPPAVILFAHGSRDPLWRAPIDAVAAQMQHQSPGTRVCCAFLELTAPDLPSTVRTLVAEGHRQLRIVPMFLGIGRHAREDLPVLVAQLRQDHPELAIELTPAVGEMPALTRCLADLALGVGRTT